MLYKLKLSDNSFYMVDGCYPLSLHRSIFKKTVTIKDYLANPKKYDNYYLIDIINKQRIIRAFEILTPTKEEEILPLGVRLKYSEDIQVNDLILGANNEPERVTELHTGEEPMFDINVNGKTYTVNQSHILELVDKDTGEHFEIQVGVYIHMDDEFKSHYVMEVADF